MKKVNLIFVFCTLFVCYGLINSSCTSNNSRSEHYSDWDDEDEDEDEDDNEDVFKKYSAVYSYNLLGSSADYGFDHDINITNSVELRLPEKIRGKKVPALRDTILMHTIGTTGGDVQELVNNYAKRNDWGNEYPIVPAKVPSESDYDMSTWESSVNGDVVGYNDKIFSYRIFGSEYTGGAHPMSYTNYINYALGSGRILKFEDIFTTTGISKLPRLIQSKAVKNDPESSDFIRIEDLPSGDKFKYEDGKIVFSYGLYEVGPYSLGFVEVSFSPSELAEYMTPYAKDLFDISN